MLLFIFTLLVAIIGLIVLGLSHNEVVDIIGIVLLVGGTFAALFMIPGIIMAHVGVNATIAEKQIVYESLCERKEVISSEYEDVSKSDVIKDIAEWNQDVYSYKHWAYNPWTNWFYSKRVADSMEMIK